MQNTIHTIYIYIYKHIFKSFMLLKKYMFRIIIIFILLRNCLLTETYIFKQKPKIAENMHILQAIMFFQ